MADNANREQAEKARDIGLRYLNAGDFEKALKFLDKSMRMCKIPGVHELRMKAVRGVKEGASRRQSAPSPPPRQPQPQPRQRSQTSAPRTSNVDNSSAENPANYPADVKAILRSKNDLYKVLGVEKTARPIDIKKAYRKVFVDMFQS
jgi:DnaJ-domain-containing protein 1